MWINTGLSPYLDENGLSAPQITILRETDPDDNWRNWDRGKCDICREEEEAREDTIGNLEDNLSSDPSLLI